MPGITRGDRNRLLSASRPGERSRTIPMAASTPALVAMAELMSATRRLISSDPENSSFDSTSAYQRKLSPTGGNDTYSTVGTDDRNTTRSGLTRKIQTATVKAPSRRADRLPHRSEGA